MDTINQAVNLIAELDLSAPEALAASTAIIAALAILTIAARKLRHLNLATAGTWATNLVILGTTVEGAVRLATVRLHADGIDALFPAILFETIAVNIYLKARAHHATYRNGPGHWAGRLYLVGATAGTIVALSATSLGESAFRIAAPLIGAWLLVLDLTPDRADDAKQQTSWRWTPRRVGIALRLVVPGKDDADKIDHEFQTARIVNAAYRLHHTSGRRADWLRARRKDRLRRLTLSADDAIVTDAEARIERASTIIETLNPTAIAARRRQREETATAIGAANTEAESCRIAATEAETRASALAATVAGLGAEAASLRRMLAAAEAASQAAGGSSASASVVAAEAEKRASELAETNRQMASELEQLRRRIASVATRQAATGRQLLPISAMPFGNGLPVIDKVAPETVAAVLAAWTQNPAATQAEISHACGKSERTVRTVLAAIRQAENGNALPANGNQFLGMEVR